MQAKYVILALMIAGAATTFLPSASATCLVDGDYVCTCGVEQNDACGYDGCAAAVIIYNGWESTATQDGGAGVLCQAPHGNAPVVLYDF